MRVHYGPELLAALLNEQPMGFYPPDALVHEAQRRGMPILGPDVNVSRVLCHTEMTISESPPAARVFGVRVGLGYVKGLAEEEAEAIVAERERSGDYRDVTDLAARAGVSLEALELVAWAGACESLPGGARRADLWRAGSARSRRQGRGIQLALPIGVAEATGLPEPDEWESVAADYTTTGITLGTHPMALMRERLEADGRDSLSSSRDLAAVPHGAIVEVAGMVVARQRPETAKGIVFILLEDEFGQLNLIIPPPLYDRNRLIVRTAPFLIARGRFERREGVTNLIVGRLEELRRESEAPTNREGSVPSPRPTPNGAATHAKPTPSMSCWQRRPGRTTSAADSLAVQFSMHERLFVRSDPYCLVHQ